MLILVARYTFFFWIFIGNSNAERLFLNQIVAADEDLLPLTACTARCFHAFSYGSSKSSGNKRENYKENEQREPKYGNKFTLQQCFSECSSNHTGSAQIQNVRRTQENFYLKLVCRDDRSLHFQIDWEHVKYRTTIANSKQLISQSSSPGDAGNDADVVDEKVIFFIRINKAKDPEHYWIYLSDENFISFSNLTQNSIYNVTAFAVHANNQYSVISKAQQFQTLQRGYVPGKVMDIRVRNFIAMPEAKQETHLMANIVWRPASDMTCHYIIICFSTESAEYDTTPFEIQNPRQLYTYSIENLTFDKEYKVGIRAKNTHNESKESGLQWMTFRAPSCVEYYNYNFEICPPPEPEGLYVEKTFIRENMFSLNISWHLPEHLPNYYELKILDLTADGELYKRNLSQSTSSSFFDEISLNGFMYEVHLTAYTHGGNSTAFFADVTQALVTIPDQDHRIKLILVIFAPIFCLVLISLTIFIICQRRAKDKRYQERCKYFEELEKKAPIDPRASFEFSTSKADDLRQIQLDLEEKIFFDDAMEIEPSDVVLYEVLGEGAFGLVRRGIYLNKKSGEMDEVAVKMLKEKPAADDIRAFKTEIEVMKSVEQHPNIVRLIGHCTKNSDELFLLTEYCSLGNLLDFLRDEWKYLHEIHLKETTTIAVKLSNKNEKSISVNSKRINNKVVADKYNNYLEKKNHSNKKIKFLTTTENSTEKSAAVNKTYGYADICTNSCKCQVEIIENRKSDLNNIAKSNELKGEKQFSNFIANENKTHKIAIKACECQHRIEQHQWLIVKNNQRNIDDLNLQPIQKNQYKQISVENKSYFKCLEIEQNQQEIQPTAKASIDININAIDSNSDISPPRVPLSAADLLDIAKQVAIGMEFLAKNKVVHRDLAARNILVAKDRTVKIADFGLSRDIYQENIYKKTGNGKLPIKWLALESMTHQVYTTQSDVWSYGILLYEIITLGGTPYPAIPTNRLLSMLKTGYRMGKPKNCGEELYKLMSSCWHANPCQRPTFTEVVKTIDLFISGDIYDQQIETAVLTKVQTAKKAEPKPPADDAYLKPL